MVLLVYVWTMADICMVFASFQMFDPSTKKKKKGKKKPFDLDAALLGEDVGTDATEPAASEGGEAVDNAKQEGPEEKADIDLDGITLIKNYQTNQLDVLVVSLSKYWNARYTTATSVNVNKMVNHKVLQK